MAASARRARRPAAGKPLHQGLRAGDLRWLADSYRQAQRVRLQAGERLRAVVQGRDAARSQDEVENGWPAAGEVIDADAVLKRIRQGEEDGPIPLLGRTYRRHWAEELELRDGMRAALEAHPAWDWLRQVKGMGPTLACKLLSRLDLSKAPRPASFWAYCGLDTVPGTRYRCAACDLEVAYPTGYQPAGEHKARGGGKPCSGELAALPAGVEGVRVARRPHRGGRRTYDPLARTTCYLIANSFVRSAGAYAEYYGEERRRLDGERPGWSDGRRHMAALRRTEKLFLVHLWAVWRAAEGRPARTAGDRPWQSPYEMIA